MLSRSRLITGVLTLALLAAACGSGSSPTTTTTAAPPADVATTVTPITLPPRPPTDYSEFRAQPTACGATAPAEVTPMTFDAPKDLALDPNSPITATIATSCGDIVVQLDPALAPETVNSFVFLAEQGYFNGTVSHRILPGFVLQAGDPTATGRNGPGYTIPDELPPKDFLYTRGILAMANAGPNTSGSQFFIMLGDAGLPTTFSVFGKTTSGFDVLDAIAAIPLAPNSLGEVSVPLETLYIDSITIDR